MKKQIKPVKVVNGDINAANCSVLNYYDAIGTRGGVEYTRLEAKAKDTRKIRGQGQGPTSR